MNDANDSALRVLRMRRTAWAALGLGTLLGLAYFVWLVTEPRGPSEFGYAPFTPEPLPYSPMRGFTYEQLWGHVARVLLLAPSLALLSFGAARLRPVMKRVDPRRLALAACTLALGISAVVMLGVLRGRAIVDDELVYRMQATFLGEGRLAAPEPGATPPDVFTISTLVGYTGKYLPGEPLVQVLGLFVGMPPLLHLPLFALTAWAWFQAMKLRAGERFACFSTMALALSPMVMLTTATGLSEPTSLCAAALLGLGLEWARGAKPLAGAALAAVALGFGLATRVQSLVPIGGVLGPCVLFSLWSRRAWGSLAAFGLLFALALAGIAAYDAALSGSPLTLPWYLQCSIEHYGFGRVWKYDTFVHTPWTALENLGVVLVRLNAWWLGFPCSLAVIALAVGLRIPTRGFRDWYGVGLAIVAFEFVYYSPGGSDTGSLYHHELVLPGAIVAAGVAEAALARSAALAATGLVVHFAFGTLSFVSEQTLRLGRLVTTIHADSDAALARVQTPALLFHETRGSEVRSAGWVFDGFPKRNRGRRDAIVTFPNLPPALRPKVIAEYPGRHCYYYRRHPLTERAELWPCEQARALMDRLPWEDEERGLWLPPTAYLRTDYNPSHDIAQRHVRDAQGLVVVTCCGLRGIAKFGASVLPSAFARCIEDGP